MTRAMISDAMAQVRADHPGADVSNHLAALELTCPTCAHTAPYARQTRIGRLMLFVCIAFAPMVGFIVWASRAASSFEAPSTGVILGGLVGSIGIGIGVLLACVPAFMRYRITAESAEQVRARNARVMKILVGVAMAIIALRLVARLAFGIT